MINFKNTCILIFICAISFETIAQTSSENVKKDTLSILSKKVKSYQDLYIAGATCTYVAVVANMVSSSTSGLEGALITSASLGAISPVLIHIGQGKARNKANKIVQTLPEGHELKGEYLISKNFYYLGFIPMVSAIITTSSAMPATLISDNSYLGPSMYGLAFLSLITRDLLWGKAMKGYKTIAKNASDDKSNASISFTPQYSSKNKSGGLAFNIHL